MIGLRVYGAGAVALGLVGLWFGDFPSVWHPVPPGVPLRQMLAYVSAACLLAGGAGVQFERSRKAALWLLGALYLVFSLLWVPRVVGHPQTFGTWGGMLEQFALVAAAMVALGLPLGRMLFGICVLSFGGDHFFALKETAAMVPKWIPPGQWFWAITTGIAHLLAGAAILTELWDVWASRLLVAMLVGFGLLLWIPSLFAALQQHFVWAANAVHLALTGAAWLVADAIAARRHLAQAVPVRKPAFAN